MRRQRFDKLTTALNLIDGQAWPGPSPGLSSADLEFARRADPVRACLHPSTRLGVP